ncbi:MAG: 6,7-dimethyl-8-ribityllumazine synthase [Ktedonobacteraceae bacterium]
MNEIVVPTAPVLTLDGSGSRIGIVVSRYNWHVTGAMLHLAREELQRLHVASENIVIAYTPGSFELPIATQMLLDRGTYDALICFGCVMKGETRHDVVVSDAAAQGIQRLALDAHIPIIFGVMCAENQQQAQARIVRGTECARAAVEMCMQLSQQRTARV